MNNQVSYPYVTEVSCIYFFTRSANEKSKLKRRIWKKKRNHYRFHLHYLLQVRGSAEPRGEGANTPPPPPSSSMLTCGYPSQWLWISSPGAEYITDLIASSLNHTFATARRRKLPVSKSLPSAWFTGVTSSALFHSSSCFSSSVRTNSEA